MINTVKRISSDPLHAIKQIEKEMMIKKSIPNEDQSGERGEEEEFALIEDENEERT